MRRMMALIGVLLVVGSVQVGLQAQEVACVRADFEATVDAAAASLRQLNQQNTPTFQSKLRLLKEKRGWSHEQFLQEATPFVRDDTIADFDQKSEEFLLRIQSFGQEEAGASAPNCAVLGELRASMQALVETQKAKWSYMFEKINRVLAP
jgi:hypothetical protein